MVIRTAYCYRVYPTGAQAEQSDWIRKPGASLVPTVLPFNLTCTPGQMVPRNTACMRHGL
jgi:hypothetical protein